jgi:hypothetical protein
MAELLSGTFGGKFTQSLQSNFLAAHLLNL